MHLPVTEYQGTSLECQRPQLLPGVTTLKCEPPEPRQEVAQEVSGECRRVSLVRTLGAGRWQVHGLLSKSLFICGFFVCLFVCLLALYLSKLLKTFGIVKC